MTELYNSHDLTLYEKKKNHSYKNQNCTLEKARKYIRQLSEIFIATPNFQGPSLHVRSVSGFHSMMDTNTQHFFYRIIQFVPEYSSIMRCIFGLTFVFPLLFL